MSRNHRKESGARSMALTRKRLDDILKGLNPRVEDEINESTDDHFIGPSADTGLNEVMMPSASGPVATNLRLLNRLTGTVKSYDKAKGFGLIMPDDSAKQHVHPTAFTNGVFFHATALDGTIHELDEGQRVIFDMDHDRGVRRLRAINVSLFDRLTGIVKFYDKAKGYGLIKPDNGGKDVFIHAVDLYGINELDEGQRVSFEIMPGT